MKILAIDLGYSSVKVAYYNDANVVQFEKYISAVAKIDNPMEMDDDIMFKLGVDTYILGDSALKVSRSLLMPLETFEDMKAIYPVWISYLLKKHPGVDKVIIGLSLAFSDRTDELLSYLYEQLMIQDDSFFMCFPQGLSAKLAYSNYGLDISSEAKNRTKLSCYTVMDLGFKTMDIAVIIKNKSAAGAALGLPCGVCKIAYNIVDYLYKEFNIQISLKEAQNIIDSDGILQKRGRKLDISPIVKQFTKQYIKDVLELLEEKYGEYLDSIDGVVIVGGGAYFFKKYISLNDKEIIDEIQKHFDLSFLQMPEDLSEYYNAYSYLKAAELKLKN